MCNACIILEWGAIAFSVIMYTSHHLEFGE